MNGKRAKVDYVCRKLGKQVHLLEAHLNHDSWNIEDVLMFDVFRSILSTWMVSLALQQELQSSEALEGLSVIRDGHVDKLKAMVDKLIAFRMSHVKATSFYRFSSIPDQLFVTCARLTDKLTSKSVTEGDSFQ